MIAFFLTMTLIKGTKDITLIKFNNYPSFCYEVLLLFYLYIDHAVEFHYFLRHLTGCFSLLFHSDSNTLVSLIFLMVE